MYADPVDTDLARHHAAMDADEAFDAWMQERKQEQAAVAEQAMTATAIWDWVDDAETMRTTEGVPYTVEEILIAALNKSEEARTEYAELMAGPAAAKLRQLLSEHWANEMWETRTACEINAAIREESEALND